MPLGAQNIERKCRVMRGEFGAVVKARFGRKMKR